ncbi:hypothetical protein EDB92DRAFT_1911389 [Lactarius akahatsu]|uniref:Uncharacterized protein n=1 Tax=Lactarius akahatsu TaxID=416441 RepID=A0AAD4L8J0_9AGAM|nr:hypothetical protein EDB92DRAFT_1911389 [Lactarius akahatsu]
MGCIGGIDPIQIPVVRHDGNLHVWYGGPYAFLPMGTRGRVRALFAPRPPPPKKRSTARGEPGPSVMLVAEAARLRPWMWETAPARRRLRQKANTRPATTVIPMTPPATPPAIARTPGRAGTNRDVEESSLKYTCSCRYRVGNQCIETRRSWPSILSQPGQFLRKLDAQFRQPFLAFTTGTYET